MPRIHAAVLSCSLSSLLLASPTRGDEPKPAGWTPERMLQVKQVGGVQVSPDGRRVAYVVRRTVMEDQRSEFLAQVHVADADGGHAFPLTQGETSAEAPQWSPDGEQIAFLTRRSGQVQVWIIRVAGGEARQATDARGGVIGFRWAPDGRRIAYVATDPTPQEREQKSKQKDDARIVDQPMNLNRLSVIEVDGLGKPRAGRPITGHDLSIHTEPGPGFDWSPDGQAIVFAHTPTARADDWTKADISIVQVESDKVRPLVHTGRAELAPFYSPDGRQVAYVASDDPPTWAYDFSAQVVPAGGGQPRKLADSFDHRPELLGWSADGRRLLYRENRWTTTQLYALPLEGEPVGIGPQDGVLAEASLNATRTAMGFSYQTADRPAEAHVARLDHPEPVQLSRVNGDLPRPRWAGPRPSAGNPATGGRSRAC